MHTTKQNHIVLDELKFKKLTKRLVGLMKEELNVDLKLSQSQEILSKSLGFRNFNDLQKSFVTDILDSENTNMKKYNVKFFLDDLNSNQINQVFSSLMPQGNKDMWSQRALYLISVVVELVRYLIKSGGQFNHINAQSINHLLNLDNLLEIYHKLKNSEAKEVIGLKKYLNHMPAFQESLSVQSPSVYEHHGYLTMQFIAVMAILEKIEENNFLVYDKNWFILNGHKFFDLKEDFKGIHNIENSWIFLDDYDSVIHSQIYLTKKDKISISDLLVNIGMLLREDDREKCLRLFHKIMENYIFYSDISSKLVR